MSPPNVRSRLAIRAQIEALEPRWLLAHFAVIGDFSSDQQTAPTRDVANLVKSWNPDFVATVGDNNYPDGAASTIDANIGQWYHQFIYPYSGSYGAGASVNEFFPSIGNHDYNSSSGYAPYLNYFTLPGNERYYTTLHGDVQLFIVNSESHEPDGTSATSTQAQWLKGALAASAATWKIVLFHHPAYSSGSIGSNTYMQWPFQQWGASAVISGHDHDYERIIKNGFPYFVDGLGGESIVGFGTTVSGSAVRYDGDYGAMLIDSNSSSITFKFINRSGQTIDTYTLGTIASPPLAPMSLSASELTSTQVQLSWTDSSPSLTSSFKIERSTDGGATFSPLSTIPAGNATYLDSGLTPGASYVYRVRASNSVGDSPYSNTASVTLPIGTTVYLSDLSWVSATCGWGPVEKDMSVGGSSAGDGHTITLNGVTYAKGLGTHAISDIVYTLAGGYSSFQSDIGVDDETGPGTIIFQVYADGTKIYDSGVMTQTSATQSINVSTVGVQQLRLHVDDAGDGINYDHADWANARLQSGAAPQPPAAPQNLAAQDLSPTQINLTWQDVANESGYRIERSTDGVTFADIGTTAANVVSYNDSTVSGNTLYYYRVFATSSAGDSPASNVVSERPMQIPQGPTGLTAAAISSSQINLSWTNPNTDDELTWKIERSTDQTNWTAAATISDILSYTDSGLAAGTTYYYRVKANNLAGDSGYSNIASAKTQPAGQQTVYLSDLAWISATCGWGPVEKDMSVGGSSAGDGHTITLNGVTYAKGLGTHAISDIVYTLAGGYSSFQSDIGVDDETGPGTVVFQVYADGTKIYDSGVMTQTSATQSINVSTVGVQQLRLHVDDAGDGINYDHADWAGARLMKAVVAPSPPSAPSALTAKAASSSQINLTWINTSPTADGFHIYRLVGTTWTLIDTTTGTSFSDTGLAAQTSYSYRAYAYNSAGESVGFSSASATTQANPTGLPTPWNQTDIGSVTPAGTGTYSAGVFTLTAAGTDVWTTADGIHFVYQPMSGDGTILAKVTGITNTTGWAKAGVMIRQSLAANSPEAAVNVTPTQGTVFTYRTTAGGSTDGDFAGGNAPYWIKLSRAGNVFTGFISSDGATWTQLGTQTITMSAAVYVGLCVTSHVATAVATGTFTGVSVNGVTNTQIAMPVSTPDSLFSNQAISPTTDLNQKDLLDA